MIRLALWLVIGLIVVAVVWLAAGRHVALLVDGITTGRVASLPVDPLMYDGGGFVIGGTSMTFAETNNLRGDLDARIDSSGRVVLCAGHNIFTLGTLTAAAPSGRPDFHFRPEPGDEVSFIRRDSLLPWPTPFQVNWLGGSSPRWKQYVYYQLAWKKPSGARLEMRWRYEREYYSGKGWTEPLMMWNSETGVLSVSIRGS